VTEIIASVALLVLTWTAFLLRNIARSLAAANEQLKLIADRQLFLDNGIWKIGRILRLNFKQSDDSFSDERMESILRSEGFIKAIRYRFDLSADTLDEARDYVGRVAERIGVEVPGSKMKAGLEK
jgi:hypothetical protein